MNPETEHNDCAEFCIDGEITLDPGEICDGFNEYFVNVGISIANDIPPPKPKHIKCLDPMVNDCIFLSPTHLLEIRDIIANIDQNTSPGMDGIHPSAIKLANRYTEWPIKK